MMKLSIVFVLLSATSSAAYGIADRAEIRTLDNGLTLVACPLERDDVVSVRLVVDAPACHPGSREFAAYRLLMTSVLRSLSRSDTTLCLLDRNSSVASVETNNHYAVLRFNVPPTLVDSLFVRMERLWAKGEPSGDGYDEAIDAEERFPWWDATLVEQLHDLEEEEEYWTVTDISFDEVKALFAQQMVGRRMSLVIAGGGRPLDRATALAENLDVIPGGRPPERFLTDRVRHLRGDLRWNDSFGPELVGFVASNEHDWRPRETDFVLWALAHWVRTSLAHEGGMFYDIEVEDHVSDNEHLIVFKPYADFDRISLRRVSREIRDSAVRLAQPENVAWWKDYLTGAEVDDRLFGIRSNDALAAADAYAYLVSLPGGRARIAGELPDRPGPEEARRYFAELLRHGQFFVIRPAEPGLAERLSDWAAAGVDFVWGGLFGPTDRWRAVAFMCHCVLVLLVLRRAEGWVRRCRCRVLPGMTVDTDPGRVELQAGGSVARHPDRAVHA